MSATGDSAGTERELGLREYARESPAADGVTAAAFLLAVGLGAVHPVGLVVGGAVVGLTAPTPLRALQLAVYVGGVLALVLRATAGLVGGFAPAVPLEPALARLVAVVALPAVGALARLAG